MLLLKGLVRGGRVFFDVLARDEQSGQAAWGNVAEHGNDFALLFASHFGAVHLEQSIAGTQATVFNSSTFNLIKLVISFDGTISSSSAILSLAGHFR